MNVHSVVMRFAQEPELNTSEMTLQFNITVVINVGLITRNSNEKHENSNGLFILNRERNNFSSLFLTFEKERIILFLEQHFRQSDVTISQFILG